MGARVCAPERIIVDRDKSVGRGIEPRPPLHPPLPLPCREGKLIATVSSLWSAEIAGDAAAVSPWTRTPAQGFTPLSAERDDGRRGPEPVLDAAGERALGYAEGHDDGRREAEAELARERAAMARLVEAVETMQPEPTQALAALLAETVERLVRQIVGAVEIDQAMLLARTQAAAALIGEETQPATLRLNPKDMARLEGATLPVAMASDASITEGSMRLETSDGWIEDGAEVRLEKLRAALDTMGAAR